MKSNNFNRKYQMLEIIINYYFKKMKIRKKDKKNSCHKWIAKSKNSNKIHHKIMMQMILTKQQKYLLKKIDLSLQKYKN